MEDKAARLGAAVAFFSMFSITPLLLILTAILGIVFADGDARLELQRGLSRFVDSDVANTLIDLADESTNKKGAGLAAISGFVVLLFGASGVFGQLQDALNSIWSVKARPGKSWLHLIKKRLLSFGMILVIGFLLLVSLSLSTALSALGDWLAANFAVPVSLASSINIIGSILMIGVLFAMIFRVLPDARVPWRDVWVGALATAALFAIGKFILAWYLGRESTTSAYGAAGAFVLVLLWVYYSSLILFFGAELTRAHANHCGRTIEPAPHAVRVKRVEIAPGELESDRVKSTT